MLLVAIVVDANNLNRQLSITLTPSLREPTQGSPQYMIRNLGPALWACEHTMTTAQKVGLAHSILEEQRERKTMLLT